MKKSVLAATALAAMGFAQQASAYSFEATFDYTGTCVAGRDTGFCDAFRDNGNRGTLTLKTGEYKIPTVTPNSQGLLSIPTVFSNYPFDQTFISYLNFSYPGDLISAGSNLPGRNHSISIYSANPYTFKPADFEEAFKSGTYYYDVLGGPVPNLLSAQLTLSNFKDTTVMAAVPEPETYAMMLAGMGLMGFVARRRKRS